MSLKTNCKIVIASDSFKDSMTSKEVNQQILKGFKRINKNAYYKLINISDGGEGFIDSLTNKVIKIKAKNPIGKHINVPVGILNNNTAIIEMAKVSGIELLKINEINANNTTSYGLGEVIRKVLDLSFSNIYIGIGGSATNDLGIGMLQALGAKFYDDNMTEVGIYGKDIFKIKVVDFKGIDKRLKKVNITIAADVSNPLFGESGASPIYGKQKGLQKEDIVKYDMEFKRLSQLLNKASNKNYTNYPGAGAAGGIGYSLASFANAKINSGFNVLNDLINLSEILKNTDILITGEGKIDSQTSYGKAPYKIATLAKDVSKNIKIYAFAGIVDYSNEHLLFNEIININQNLSLEKALKKGPTRTYRSAVALANKLFN